MKIDKQIEFIVLEKEEYSKICQDIRAIRDAVEGQTNNSGLKKWLSTKETAELLNVKVRTIYHYCQKDLLHPHQVGGRLLFDRFEIEALIEAK